MTEGFPLRQKLVATGLHLLASIVFVGALLLPARLAWYPGFLFETDGGWQGLRIVLFVDLVLGPVLTFVVFRRGKKGLLGDLVLIGLMQVAALLAGGWILYSERPLLLVFHEGRFYSVTADDYLESGVPVPDLAGIDARPPDYVVLEPPEDPIVQSEVRLELLQRRQFLYTHVPWMKPAEGRLEVILDAAVSRETLTEPPERAQRIEDFEAWQADSGMRLDDVALIPYSSRFRVVYLIVDRSTGRILDALDINSR